MKLPKLAIDNYQFTILGFFILTILGVSSYLSMPRMENPEMTVPGGSVFVIYPGANPTDMEQLISIPLEEAINEIDDIKKIETTLGDGFAAISVEFIFGTNAKDKYDELLQKVNSLRNELPPDILSLETMQWKSSDVSMLQLALVSDKLNYEELDRLAENLKNQINRIPEVRKTEIIAFPEQEVRISPDFEKMAMMNISIQDLINAIQSNNANIPGGSINLSGRNFGIRTSGSYTNLEEIRNTVVQSYQGKIIFLKNIATVEFRYEDQEYIARYKGEKAVFVTVKQKEGLNIFKINEKLEPVIENFKISLEQDCKLEYVFNQTKEVDTKINGFISNLFQGIILVGLVILLALGFKSALIVIIAIPLSNLIGLAFVDMAGFGMEQISIAGLVVALGLLVDNSIVTIENINRFYFLGHKPREAAILGTSEIGWPIVSSTVTTLLAFVPIITMPDKAGDFIRSMPVTIFATLTVSLFIALTLNPLIAAKTLKRKNENLVEKESVFKRSLKRFIHGPYSKALNFTLDNRGLTIFLAILLLGLSGYLATFIGISFFPKAEKPQFMIRISTPDGTNLAKTDEAARYIESILDTMPDVSYYAANVGHGNPRIYYNVMTHNYAKNFAEIFVQLKEFEFTKYETLVQNLRDLFGEYSGAKITIKEFQQGVPVAAPIMVYINGDNMDMLEKIAGDVENQLKKQPGTINVENQLAKKRTDIFININKEKANMLGVPIHEIDRTVRIAINGMAISSYRDKNSKDYDLVLRSD
ncbi:MAG: efflux RND transporter permease subunit, partial [Bacteroidota bacterium]